MNQTARPLIPEQRHQEILRLLRREGVLRIRSITDYMDVSHMTVRRDIAALENSGRVVSVQGGVRLAEWTGPDLPKEREFSAQLELPRKQAISQLAAQLIEDDMVVFLDAGTTCQSVVTCLGARKNLTVVINNFYVVTRLFAHPRIQVIHTGGAEDPSSGSSEGRIAADAIKGVNIDLSLLSTGTWNMDRGLTTPSMDKVEVKLAALQASTSCFVLADSTKFGMWSRNSGSPQSRNWEGSSLTNSSPRKCRRTSAISVLRSMWLASTRAAFIRTTLGREVIHIVHTPT